MPYNSKEGQYNSMGTWIPRKRNIGKNIRTISELQIILDRYYTEYMNTKLNLYTDNMFKLMNQCLTSNLQLYDLFKVVTTKRSLTNKLRFRKNNTLNNLIQLYRMILDMLENYKIQNTSEDLMDYSCFCMLVNVSTVIKQCYHLNEYFRTNGDLIDLLLELREIILSLAHTFLNKIKLSYDANYSITIKNLTNTSRLQNFTSTTSLLSTNPISSPILNTSQRNNKQKYDAGIDLYIQFLSMYNRIFFFIDTFKQYSTSTGNYTPIFIEEIDKMFNDISKNNENLFKEYIKYLGRFEIKNSVRTGFEPNANSLLKGLYHEKRAY